MDNIGLTSLPNMPYDGQCAFAAIAHQLFVNGYASVLPQPTPGLVRADVVRFINGSQALKDAISQRLTETSIEQYLKDMAVSTTWADENTIHADGLLYDVKICILSSGSRVPVYVGSLSSDRTITLSHVSVAAGEDPTHYVSLQRVPAKESPSSNAIVTQSEVEILEKRNVHTETNPDKEVQAVFAQTPASKGARRLQSVHQLGCCQV
jgi:hypothetical protein